MRWLDLIASLRYIIELVMKIVSQIRMMAKRRRLKEEIERKDDETTRRELDRIL